MTYMQTHFPVDTNATMTCDNDCTLWGWTEHRATLGPQDWHVSVHPDADLNDTVHAFDHDAQEMILLDGWRVTFTAI